MVRLRVQGERVRVSRSKYVEKRGAVSSGGRD